MQKSTLVFLAAWLISLAAMASGERLEAKGDPGRPKEKPSVFGLSDGYFSFFTFFTVAFSTEEHHADSLAAPRRRDGRLPEEMKKPE